MSVLNYHFCVGIYSDVREARYGSEGCVTAQNIGYTTVRGV